MSGNLLEKYTGRAAPSGNESDAISEPDGTEDLGVFGWLRGNRERAVMLELRKKDGNVLAIGYGWIERIEFDPSSGITLHCSGQKIMIKGRNLNAEARAQVRLFQGLTRHRVPWVQEADRSAAMQAGDDAILVEAIQW
jgi:hypothetical protein